MKNVRDFELGAISICLALLAVVLLLGLSILLHGVALSFLWAWFLVPTFALQPISVGQAIGLCVVIGFLKIRHQSGRVKVAEEDEKKQLLSDLFVVPFVYPATSLLLGFIVKSLI